MIRIALTSVLVDDQSKALRFYTEALGFVKKHDVPMGQFRWLTVVAPGGSPEIELLLEPNENPAAKTFQQALREQGIPATSFVATDLQAEYERMTKLGVVFTKPPTKAGPVTIAVFEDAWRPSSSCTRSSGSRSSPALRRSVPGGDRRGGSPLRRRRGARAGAGSWAGAPRGGLPGTGLRGRRGREPVPAPGDGARRRVPPAIREYLLACLRPLFVTTFAYGVPDRGGAQSDRRPRGDGRRNRRGRRLLGPLPGRAGGARARLRSRATRGAAAPRRGAVAAPPIKVGGPAEALAAAPGARALLLCWPPGVSNRKEADAGAAPIYSPMADQALAAFRGACVVFVGARTRSFGSPAFYARLERGWRLEEQLPLPNLGDWRDAVHVYRRRVVGCEGRSVVALEQLQRRAQPIRGALAALFELL